MARTSRVRTIHRTNRSALLYIVFPLRNIVEVKTKRQNLFLIYVSLFSCRKSKNLASSCDRDNNHVHFLPLLSFLAVFHFRVPTVFVWVK